MIVGKTSKGTTPAEIAGGTLPTRYKEFVVPAMPSSEMGMDAMQVTVISAYLDGRGSGSGDARARPEFRTAAGVTVGYGSPERVIVDGSPPAWYSWAVVGLDGGGHVEATAGQAYRMYPAVVGSSTEPGHLTARYYHTGTNDSASVYGTLQHLYAAPDEADPYLSRLPYDLAQRTLGGGLRPGRALRGTAGWHHTWFDPEIGYVAIARSEGEFADLVGERLRLTTVGSQRRSAVVYCHDESGELFDDLSLPRAAFVRLGNLWADALEVNIEVLE